MNIGRLGRSAFAVSMLAYYAIIIALIILRTPDWIEMSFIFISFIWMLFVYVGRLHDVGYSGWWSLLVLWTSLLGLIALGAWPGEKAPNKYGEVPPSEISHLWNFWRSKMS